MNFNKFTKSKSIGGVLDEVKKIPWILGKDAFLFIMIFIFIDIFLGEYLFYKYVFLVKSENPETSSISTEFKENTYEKVLEELKLKADIFENSKIESYDNPFKVEKTTK